MEGKGRLWEEVERKKLLWMWRKNCSNKKQRKKITFFFLIASGEGQGQAEILQYKTEKEKGSLIWASSILLPEACLQHVESFLH